MREIAKEENSKRGCSYCTKMYKVKGRSERGTYEKYISMCPFKECPYRETDEFDTFEDYCSTMEISIDELLKEKQEEEVSEVF